jgi:flagellar protein FliO/FliZ
VDTLVVALRVALSLGVVLALLWVLQRKLSKGTLGKRLGVRQRGRRTATVNVVARQGIGGKASVVVVDVEGERLVLGVTEHQVTMLTSGETPAPTLEIVTGPIALPTPAAAPEPTRVEAAPRDAFRAELELQAQAEPSLQTGAAEPLPMRPRGRTRKAAPAPAAQQLQGSILSPDTWRQAAQAVRSRRAG